ncbi:ArsC/Spx/MgsR family protein [Lactococcus formosensis]|uniref:ArsC/Spx/MgsR family protein n=3 Tax=Lactococcus formosensis TaxID=1281486 RepID=UPI00311B0CE3
MQVYYKRGCNSSRQTLKWFKNHSITISKAPIAKISKEDIVKTLSMTDKGLEDIVKHPTRSKSETRKGILHLYELSFNEGLEYLKHNTNLLQTPIVLDDNKLLVGYNSEEIRKYLPQKYRRYHLEKCQ